MAKLRSDLSSDALGTSDLLDTQTDLPNPVRPGTSGSGAVGTLAASGMSFAAAPTPGAEAEVAFISGVTSSNTVVATSYLTWNGDNPATYSTTSFARKWGSPTPGTSGGTVTYWFDTASNWNTTEQNALVSGLDLWSAEADIAFTHAASAASANFIFYRGTDGSAFESPNATTTTVGSGSLGQNLSTGTYISIDTSVAGFGPIGDSFSTYGSYPWTTLVHEEGHLIGLGHGGPYNGNVAAATQQFSAYDTRLWSLMSYIDPWNANAKYYSSYPVTQTNWGVSPDGSNYEPTTPMILDILAAQRLYGAATSGPLADGGEIFGFNSNITGSISRYFDFTVNTNPVITIWDGGTNNTLDLSGWSAPATINLNPGTFSSANFETNNIGIAEDTIIQTAIGGSGNDTFIPNSYNDTIDGRLGTNTVVFNGVRSQYQVTQNADGSFHVIDLRMGSPNGTDDVSNVQLFRFADVTDTSATLIPSNVGAPVVGASGDFNTNALPDFVWRNSSAMAMWQYDPTAQTVTSNTLAANDPNWTVIGSAHFSRVNGASPTTTQMLMDYVPTGTMTLWWVSNALLTGIDLGQKWSNIGFLSAGQFTTNGGAVINDFLVHNRVDGHIYDWWISPQNQLTGQDLTAASGVSWSNVSLVATDQFTANGGTNLLVSNTLDHHLYDWWIGADNALNGIDLGPYWSNVAAVATGQFVANTNTNLLVTNTLDNHLYDWWIDDNGVLAGTDLGAYWANVQLVTVGRFDNNSSNTQMLVQNTVDHHLYEWWITPQGALTGIDLTASSGIPWSNLQLIGSSHFNSASAFDQLLVRNTSDGHFYEWWVNGGTLAGVDLGAVPPGGNAGSSAGAALMAQSIASFDAGGAPVNTSFSPLGSGPLEQQPQIATPTNQPLVHS
jgi:Peptidase M10 serralysin C terminal